MMKVIEFLVGDSKYWFWEDSLATLKGTLVHQFHSCDTKWCTFNDLMVLLFWLDP